MRDLIFWLIVAAAMIHIVEEYFSGWIEWAKKTVSSVDLKSFVVVNVLFLLLCAAAAMFDLPVLRLAVLSLIGSNIAVHIAGALRDRGYVPGTISAVFAYVPLMVTGLVIFFRMYDLPLPLLILSICLGPAIMAVPFIFQVLRKR